ncbi:MAG: DivIVA domain-containing protein [Dermatophilaceae bacterium]
MLTADLVRNATFTTTQFRGGYDERQVDDSLDVVIAALEDYERGARPTLTSADVRAMTFMTASFRRGYDAEDVDRMLQEVIATLEHYERGGRTPLVAPAAPAAPAAPRGEGAAARLGRWLRGDPS